jgi:hypothetical protein
MILLILYRGMSSVDLFNANEKRCVDSLYLLFRSCRAIYVLQKSYVDQNVQRSNRNGVSFCQEFSKNLNELSMYFLKTNFNGSILYQDSDTNNRTDSPNERKAVFGSFCHNT